MSTLPDHSTRIDHEAAAWVVKHERGLEDSEQDAFSQWLAANSAHGRSFARQRHNWRLLDQLADWRPAYAGRPNPDLLAPQSPRKPGWRRGDCLALAMAAAVVLGFFGWQGLGPRDAAAARVEQRTLEDGSVVDLNQGAAISIDFGPAERRIALTRGEAHFTVTSNPLRPFVVTARGVEVKAVGTAFNVRIERDEVKVLVTEGKVRVAAPPGSSSEAAAATPVAAAGELVVVPLARGTAGPRVAPVGPAEMQRLLAWQPRTLDFTAAALPDILAEFNRHNRTQMVITEPALESLRLTISFRSDNVEGFARLLEGAFHVEVERSGDVIALRSAP